MDIQLKNKMEREGKVFPTDGKIAGLCFNLREKGHFVHNAYCSTGGAFFSIRVFKPVQEHERYSYLKNYDVVFRFYYDKEFIDFRIDPLNLSLDADEDCKKMEELKKEVNRAIVELFY